MQTHFNGHNALIYGANGGIGSSLAKEFIKRGAKPLLLGRNQGAIQELADQLGLSPDRYFITQNLAQDQGAIQTWLQGHGQLHHCIHAAGGAVMKPLLAITPQEWDEQLQVHLSDAFHLVQAVWPLRAGQLELVFFGSASTLQPWPKNSLYGGLKAGLAYFCQSLNEELHRQGGRVWLIEPGAVQTAFFDQVKSHLPREKMIQPEILASWILDQLTLPRGMYFPRLTPMSG